MGVQSASYAGTSEQQPAATLRSAAPVVIAVCCVAIFLALVVGVGLASNLVLRHIVQTLPCLIGCALGFRRSRLSSWSALPVFLFWLAIMILIWLYLLGIAHVLSGHFSGVEIAMTLTVGVASVAGIAGCLRFKSALSPLAASGLFIFIAIMQWLCFRISLLPAIALR